MARVGEVLVWMGDLAVGPPHGAHQGRRLRCSRSRTGRQVTGAEQRQVGGIQLGWGGAALLAEFAGRGSTVTTLCSTGQLARISVLPVQPAALCSLAAAVAARLASNRLASRSVL